MNERTESRTSATLSLLILAYCAASLLHFAHNATYLHEYPNLPAWLTSGGVWLAWCGETAIGAIGYWLYRRVSQVIGLATIAVYALLGFGGFDHYVVAPVAAHSVMMNATILLEAVTATALLISAVRSIFLLQRSASRS